MTQAADARLSDNAVKEKAARDQRQAALLAALKRDLNETFSTGSGQRTLRWIMELCQWERSPVIGDEVGNPQAEGTIYNAAQQNVYRAIRKHIRKDILMPVEFKGLEQDEADLFS